ncbi:MAG: hypothetical protein WC998_00600 [Candidatus Paceibacterota bacterium]
MTVCYTFIGASHNQIKERFKEMSEVRIWQDVVKRLDDVKLLELNVQASNMKTSAKTNAQTAIGLHIESHGKSYDLPVLVPPVSYLVTGQYPSFQAKQAISRDDLLAKLATLPHYKVRGKLTGNTATYGKLKLMLETGNSDGTAIVCIDCQASASAWLTIIDGRKSSSTLEIGSRITF